MTINFPNASPEAILLGADDQSIRQILPEPEPIPQHLPKVFIYSPKGTTKSTLTGAAKLIPLYGAATFDKNKAYYKHTTRFLETIAGTGNTCMVQRLVPTDAGVRSNVAIYIDVLETEVPNYVRNSMGELVVDPDTNDYKVDPDMPTIIGTKIKYISEYNSDTEPSLGLLSSKQGTMVDGDGNHSTMYPLFELRASEKGKYYDNIGISFTSLFKADVDSKVVSSTKSMTFGLSLVTRPDEKSSPVILRTLAGEPTMVFSFKEKVINPNTDSRFDLEYVFNNNWFNETDPLKTLRYNDYQGMYFYRSNYENVLDKVMGNEKEYVSSTATTWDDGEFSSTLSWFDYTTADEVGIEEDKYVLNLFACKSSKNIPYFTVMYSDDASVTTGNQKEINLSTNTPVFLQGGSDGTLSNEMFETLVVAEMQKYLDPDSEVHDLAINVDSIMYDSGFSLNTKKELCNYIGLRKDTAIVLSTHDDALGERDLPLSDARAIGVALRTRLKLMPESEYFGTGVARGCIVVGTTVLRDGSTANRIPLTYEIAYKSARMMGAGTGKWKAVELFDRAPNNIITTGVDVHPAFIPAGIKPTLWADGLIWAQPYDRVQYHFPALQTVYDNDTSVLNNYFTVMALCTLSKIGAEAWRQFTGTTGLTDGEFTAAVDAYVNNRLKDIFAGMFVVVPETVITEADKVRGYSWKLVVKLYANNMRTKCVYSSQVYRMSDLEQ